MVKIGLLRVLSTEDEELLSSHGRLIEEFIPDPRLQTVNRCIEGHPRGVWNEEEEARAVPKILRLGQAMAREDGVDALIVSCASDPGVKGLRAELGIPVLGAGSAAASAALALGRPVGVLSITDTVPQPVVELLGERIVALAKPEGVETTVDLMVEEGRQGLIAAGEKLAKVGAEAILLACTGFSTIRAARPLEEALGLQVIDPVIAAGLLAYYAALGHRGGVGPVRSPRIGNPRLELKSALRR